MLYVLLFIGLNQPPSQLGTYTNLQSCERAVRSIYEAKFAPRGIELDDQLKESIKFAVDNKLKYQREYICQPRG